MDAVLAQKLQGATVGDPQAFIVLIPAQAEDGTQLVYFLGVVDIAYRAVLVNLKDAAAVTAASTNYRSTSSARHRMTPLVIPSCSAQDAGQGYRPA
jgi:hypothetical protein